jgi:hypothetical protein
MEQQHLPGMEPEPPNGQAPVPYRCVTAFLVMVMPDGIAMAHSDTSAPFLADREANLHDMYAACATVMKDIEIMQTTQNVVQNVINAQLQVGQQMAQAQQNQQIAQQIMMPPNRAQRRH